MPDASAVDVRLGIVKGPLDDLQLWIDGTPWEVPWPKGYAPSAGDTFKVTTVNGEVASVWPFTATPRPLLGDVPLGATPAGGYLTVNGLDGRTYQCRYEGAAPDEGTRVLIGWAGSDPWVRNLEAAYAPGDPAPPAGPAAPPTTTRDTTPLIATAAGTWRPTWSRWEPGEVTQGTWQGRPYRGAWFYGNAGGFFAGKIIERIVMTVGPRTDQGNHNDPAPAHFTVASGSGPNNWSEVPGAGVYDVGVDGSWKRGPRSFDLPAHWGALLAAGHGIGIAGNPYLGFAGGAPSGRLDITWRNS